MSTPYPTTPLTGDRWVWPINPSGYDRSPPVTPQEGRAILSLNAQLEKVGGHERKQADWAQVRRLVVPLRDAQSVLVRADSIHHARAPKHAVSLILRGCAALGSSFWTWGPEDWAALIKNDQSHPAGGWPKSKGDARTYILSYAYLLTGFTEFQTLPSFSCLRLAWRVFSQEPVDTAVEQITGVLRGWGYCDGSGQLKRVRRAIVTMLLVNRSPYLDDLSTDSVLQVRQRFGSDQGLRAPMYGIHRALASLGHLEGPVRPYRQAHKLASAGSSPEAWTLWVERWYATSTLQTKTRMRGILLWIGRWLASEQLEVTEPKHWTRQTCLSLIAAIDGATVGQFGHGGRGGASKRNGEPFSPRTKAGYLTVARIFFRDCQEWGWIPRHFDPGRALATPKAIKALIGPDPRVVADDTWAKLMWAGLNLEASDLPALSQGGNAYPIEMARAITLTWLFSGLRSNEIARLRLGCIRWQRDDVTVPGRPGDVLARDAVCLLDVPVNKTGTAFSKPVDPLLGRIIAAWEAVRPVQPKLLDRKTGERVEFLFCQRGYRLDKSYINKTVIPSLCRKAGMPDTDVRGKITSHRARATIASQLFNSKEPMTLFELQAWLGHKTPESTQHYARITPTKLAAAYGDAGYFARNVRTIEVLVDREAVENGAAGKGKTWQYYDLGHGYCTYSFFEQCPHRMACARCDFYVPKGSSRSQLLEAKGNLQRMAANIPLTEEERAAVDDGGIALDRLLKLLADMPTPDDADAQKLKANESRHYLPLIAPTAHHRPTPLRGDDS